MKHNVMPSGAEGELIREQLRALGVQYKVESTEDRVFNSLIKASRGAKKIPSLPHMYMELGLPETTVRSALRRLKNMGKVLNPIKGVWIPVVVPKKDTNQQV